MQAKKVKDIRTIQRFLLHMRETFDNSMSVQQLNTLLEVYVQNELTQAELVKRAKLSRSGASKAIAGWSSLTSNKTKGPGLVESRVDPMNMKFRVISITNKGVAAVEDALNRR